MMILSFYSAQSAHKNRSVVTILSIPALFPMMLSKASIEPLIIGMISNSDIDSYSARSLHENGLSTSILNLSDTATTLHGPLASHFCVVRSIQFRLLGSLELYKENFIKHTWITYRKMLANPYHLMRISHAADAFGYTLIEFLQAFELIQLSDLDTLIAEINEAQDNVSLAYASSYAGLFQPIM